MRFLLLTLLILGWAPATWADGRFALVIGNGDYESAGRLANPVNDATDMARALEQVGYAVSLHLNADHLSMSQALRSFRRDSAGAEHAIIYFAGHGVAPTGTSYVLPTDARVTRPEDLEIEAIDVDALTAHVAHASELGLIILDACRDTPMLAQMIQQNPTRSLSRGLTRAQPRGGTLIAYATEAGAVAADGDQRNSPYTAALIETLNEPSLEVGFFFRKVRDRVLTATAGAQRPDHYSALPAKQIFLNQTVPQPAALPGASTRLGPSNLHIAISEPVIDMHATLPDDETVRTNFENWRTKSYYGAFAASTDGAYWWAAGYNTVEAAEDKVLRGCGAVCFIVATLRPSRPAPYGSVPLSQINQGHLAKFRTERGAAAFAVAPNGHAGWAYNFATIAEAEVRALEECRSVAKQKSETLTDLDTCIVVERVAP